MKKILEENVKEYVFERFQDVKKSKKIKNLVEFQAMNKYMIMSHSQNELKIMGNIVANHSKDSLKEIFDEYEKHLSICFESNPTLKTNSNVIMHIFGFFSKDFTRLEKEKFLELLKKFRNEEISLGEILCEINPIIYRFNKTYLANQTYFLLYANPQPGNLFQILSEK